MRANWWDNLNGSDKVETLYQTFDLLKQRYPQLTPYLRLKFDDNREGLTLNFGEYAHAGSRFSLTGQNT